jgi:integrase/recombinase XerD
MTFFISRTRMNQSGTTAIYCRLTQNGKRKEFSTTIFCTPKSWDTQKEIIRGNTQTVKMDNEKLNDFKARLKEIILIADKAKEAITTETLKKRFFDGTQNYTVLGLYRIYLEQTKFDKEDSTKIKKESMMRNIQKFFKHKSIEDLPYRDVKKALAGEMYQYFQELHEPKFQHNHTARVINYLKAVFQYAYENELVERNVFASVRYNQKKSKEIIALTFEELQRLENYQFKSDRLQKVADCFIFQCSTSLAYIDFANLTDDNIKTSAIDGRLWIYTNRQKTGESQNLPILPSALKIIEKYGGTVKNLPILTNQKYNAYLKEIAGIMDFNINLTTHVCRGTWAMIGLNHYQFSLEVVSKALGHSSIRTTERYYAKVDENRISKEMRNIV